MQSMEKDETKSYFWEFMRSKIKWKYKYFNWKKLVLVIIFDIESDNILDKLMVSKASKQACGKLSA